MLVNSVSEATKPPVEKKKIPSFKGRKGNLKRVKLISSNKSQPAAAVKSN